MKPHRFIFDLNTTRMRPFPILATAVMLGTHSSAFCHSISFAIAHQKPKVEPVQSSPAYDSVSNAIAQLAVEYGKSQPTLYLWNKTQENAVGQMASTSNVDMAVVSANVDPKVLSSNSGIKFLIVVNELKSSTTCPKPAYAKREFAMIPSSIGIAKIEVFNLSENKIVATAEATSTVETSASPSAAVRVMKQALKKAISKFLSHS